MKNKIVGILTCVILVLTAVVFIQDNMNVEANPGSGGEGDDGSSLNNSYIWDQTVSFANVIYEYPPGLVPKGRAYGSWGGNYTINNILLLQMENEIGLEDVHTEQIKHISGIEKNYTTIIDVNDFQLTVNNNDYPFPNLIPVQESFVVPSGFPNRSWNRGGSLTHNYTLTNVEIYPLPIDALFPLGGTYNNYSFNITSFTQLNNNTQFLVGNITYITANDTVPDAKGQLGRVFLLDETQECSNKIDNLTTAEGCILINQGTEGISNDTASKCPCSIVRISTSDGNTIKELMENHSTILVDNVTGNLTFTYNLSEGGFLSSDFVYIMRIPAHDEPPGYLFLGWFGWWVARAKATWLINQARWLLGLSECKAMILYDSFEHHFMLTTHHHWDHTKEYSFLENLKLLTIGLPTFTLNYTVGSFLYDNHSCTSLTGYANQEYFEETNEKAGVEAYNVIGNITINKSPNDAIAILSNRYDGWWSEAPGDSGVGGAIILAIAKYFKDHNITPKYNLTFLFTTGEEYGLRGAWHYNDSHKDDNIIFWLVLDQLAFNQSDTVQEVGCGNISRFDIIWTIMNLTQYEERTGYDIKEPTLGAINGTEQGVFNTRPNCSTVSISKDQNWDWDRWHRTGMNYKEGDSLKYTDRNDVNITAELAWNITKYFLVNPDCWLSNISHTAVDSDNDGDNLNDTIMASFKLNTILPHDLVQLEYTVLKRVGTSLTEYSKTITNYTISSNGLQKTLNFSIPENDNIGNYSINLKVYNSTARINKIVGIKPDNYDDYNTSSEFLLYHPLGYHYEGVSTQNIEDRITGVSFKANENASANNITVYLQADLCIPPPKGKCIIYRTNDSKLIATTAEITVATGASPEWKVFTFYSDPLPQLVKDTEYTIVCWTDNNCMIYYDNSLYSKGRYNTTTYGAPPTSPVFTNENRLYSIYCSYTPN